MTGAFISFEGGEGAGKSTQIKRLAKRLEAAGHKVTVTREPGGTKRAEKLRDFVLAGHGEALGQAFEALIFTAARLDHLENLIIPALEAGEIVLCDRFADSTRVYQGNSDTLKNGVLDGLEELVRDLAWPDITVVLDVDPDTGMQRAVRRREDDQPADRFEKEASTIQHLRRLAFLDIAEQDPDRCFVVNGNEPAQKVEAQVWEELEPRLKALLGQK